MQIWLGFKIIAQANMVQDSLSNEKNNKDSERVVTVMSQHSKTVEKTI